MRGSKRIFINRNDWLIKATEINIELILMWEPEVIFDYLLGKNGVKIYILPLCY